MAGINSKVRAPRNRTITLSESERVRYAQKLLDATQDASCIRQKNFLCKTILGDTLSVLPQIPSEVADLIIVDPPYNLAKNFNGSRFSAMSDAQYEAYLDSWMGEVVRILKPEGSLYVCGDWKSSSAIQRSLQTKLCVLNRITWGREKGRGASANWKNGMEDIWFAVKDPKKYFFDVDAVRLRRRVIAPYKLNGEPKDWNDSESGKFRDTAPSNFWDDISIPFWSMPENTDHPTQKPEKLIAKLILASSKPGDVVFDPFLGSGTTSVVAKKLGRNFFGIEQNLEYACLCEKRLEIAEQDSSIQGYTDGVFWERNSLGAQKSKKNP
jgi:site-specific DNA-methyltransferase (adenine-specific)